MIAEDRQLVLGVLVDFIIDKLTSNKTINLNFICTHNSRRSHLSQIWAQIAAFKNGFSNIHCFSGGTEATAVFPMIIETLRSQGLQVLKLSETENPVYAIRYNEIDPPVIAFSKTYDHPFNPKVDFAAIMTCNHADQNCPVIPGTEKRIPITYVDPKVSDGTDKQEQVYMERSEQIRAEMNFVFESVAQYLHN